MINYQNYVCPNCHGNLALNSISFKCQNCKNSYPIDKTIPDFLLVNNQEKGEILRNRASQFDELSKIYGSSLWGGSPWVVVWLLTRKIRNRNWIGLDISCGAGQVTRPMAKKISYVHGVDISMGMVQKAAELSKKDSIDNIAFARCDVENLPFTDSSFDFVTCSGALHAYPDAEKALKEMWRVLKTNSILAIMALLEQKVPNIIDPAKRELKKSSTKDDAEKFNNASNSMKNVDAKLHRFTLEELKDLINKTGFNDFKYIKFGPVIIFNIKKL
ncbi:MAG: methyltransferase domain-containing protein [Spirochaetes bacterium]|nr:methyltransferase domain-containing protein [Spirochaetota bacterium]